MPALQSGKPKAKSFRSNRHIEDRRGPLFYYKKRKVDPMQVIKRDGRAVPFDRIKIVRAIEAAMKETDAGVDRD